LLPSVCNTSHLVQTTWTPGRRGAPEPVEKDEERSEGVRLALRSGVVATWGARSSVMLRRVVAERGRCRVRQGGRGHPIGGGRPGRDVDRGRAAGSPPLPRVGVRGESQRRSARREGAPRRACEMNDGSTTHKARPGLERLEGRCLL